MKNNYRKSENCLTCKFHIGGDMTNWPNVYCNLDNSFICIDDIFSASDKEILESVNWEDLHEADIKHVCDDYKPE